MIASHDQLADAAHAAPAHDTPAHAAHDTPAHNAPHDRGSHTTPDSITPMQRWAHLLVLEMLKANLPLPALAEHLKIPFHTLIQYINLPEVRAEIDAYEELCAIRARLLGQTARPISLRRLLDVLESPSPRPSGRDPDADTRALHRHAELIRRTATTIAKESRALTPKPAPKLAASPKPAHGTASVSERTSASPAHASNSAKREPTRSSVASEPASDFDDALHASPVCADSHVCEDADMPPERRTTAPPEPSPVPSKSASDFDAAKPNSPNAGSIDASAPSESSSPSSPSSSTSPSDLRDLRVQDASPPRHSAPSANSAFSSRSRHARDRPAA